MRSDGGVGAFSVRATTPLHPRVHMSAVAGIFADTKEGLDARDALVGFPILAVTKPTFTLTVQPGFTVPLGSFTAGLEYTLLATGSVDPTLGLNLAAGETWLVLAGASGRYPVYAGVDRIRSGFYGRFDLRGARRIGGGAVFAGLSLVGQETRGLTSPGFVELAPIAGAMLPLGDTWGGELSVRVPAYNGDRDMPYYTALRVGLTKVFDSKPNRSHH